MNLRWSRRWATIVGVLLCAALSGLTAVLFSSHSSRAVVPLAFVAVIVALALRYGAAVGIFGSVAAALIFSLFLFEPLHKFDI